MERLLARGAFGEPMECGAGLDKEDNLTIRANAGLQVPKQQSTMIVVTSCGQMDFGLRLLIQPNHHGTGKNVRDDD